MSKYISFFFFFSCSPSHSVSLLHTTQQLVAASCSIARGRCKLLPCDISLLKKNRNFIWLIWVSGTAIQMHVDSIVSIRALLRDEEKDKYLRLMGTWGESEDFLHTHPFVLALISVVLLIKVYFHAHTHTRSSFYCSVSNSFLYSHRHPALFYYLFDFTSLSRCRSRSPLSSLHDTAFTFSHLYVYSSAWRLVFIMSQTWSGHSSFQHYPHFPSFCVMCLWSSAPTTSVILSRQQLRMNLWILAAWARVPDGASPSDNRWRLTRESVRHQTLTIIVTSSLVETHGSQRSETWIFQYHIS